MALRLEACHIGGVMPRSEELIASYRRLAEGRESLENLTAIARREIAQLIEAQRRLRLTYPVEGQLLWHDILRPFAESLEGLKPGPLTRWFDNNLFYRKPVITSNIVRKGKILERYIFLDLLRGLRWKLILPEPYTFHRLSQNQAYSCWRDMVLDFAEVLSEELRSLDDCAPALVQLSAPSLAEKRLSEDQVETVKECFRVIRRGVNGRLMVHLFFYDASEAFPWILDSGVDVIGVDPFSTDLEKIKGYSFEGSLAVGCLDARNSYVESVDEIAAILSGVADCVDATRYHITTNTDLEYLPRRVADLKMERLAEAFKALGGELD